MAKEVCVFCGEEVSSFSVKTVPCGPTYQYACKTCEKEVTALSEEERCRRAVQRGIAQSAVRLQEYIEIMDNAEAARPACLRCGEKLVFGEVQTLDNSPHRDSMFATGFKVLPACCTKCGKMELYNPVYISGNKLLAYLVNKDTKD